MSGIAPIAPPAMSGTTHRTISENWARAAFVKPLQGSRGDFAQTIHDEASLDRYLREVSPHYDAILIQPLVSGIEYRIFLLDDEVIYAARKYPPGIVGDGVRSIRELLAAHDAALQARGLSPASAEHDTSLDVSAARKASAGKFPGG